MLDPALRTPDGALAVLKKLLAKAAMRLRREQLLASAMAVRIRYLGIDARWEGGLHFEATDDSRTLLHLLGTLLDAGRVRGRAMPGPAHAAPLSVSVTLLNLAERAQTSGSLFATGNDARHLDVVVDRINAKYGFNKVYFGSTQAALARDAAPLRIPFNRIPDAASEHESEGNALWLQSLNRFKAMAESEHRRRSTAQPKNQ